VSIRDEMRRRGPTPSIPSRPSGRIGTGYGPTRGELSDGDGTGNNSARDEMNRRRNPVTPRSPGAPRSSAPRQTPQDFPELVWGGERAPLAIVYGRTRVKAFPWVFEQDGSDLVIGYVFALGEIQEVENVYVNSVEFDDTSANFDGWTVNTYTGTDSQTADGLLSSAITGYTDALDGSGTFSGEGIAYLVISAPATSINGLPSVEALVKGRKVNDYRGSPTTTAYSDNPALCLADLVASDVYGWGKTLDTDSVNDAADACDDAVDGVARRKLGYALYDPRPTTQVVQELADLAGVILDRSGDTVRFVPDRLRSTDVTLDDKTQIISSRYERRRTSAIPDAVEVSWYDADTGREKSVRHPRTQTNNLLRVRLAGIPNYSQALREAEERYDRARLEDLTADVVVAGVGSRIQIGDVVAVTDRTIDIEEKQFRVNEVQIQSPGVHRLALTEYQGAVYNDDFGTEDVAADTGFSDGNFDAPGTPLSFLTDAQTTFSERGARFERWQLLAEPADDKTVGFIYSREIEGNVVAKVYSPVGETATLIARRPDFFTSYTGKYLARSVGFNGLVSADFSIFTATSAASSSFLPDPTLTASTSDKTLSVNTTSTLSTIPSYAAWASVSIYRTDASPEELIYTTLTIDDSVLFYYDKLSTSQSYRAEVRYFNGETLSLETVQSDTVST